MEIFVDSSVDDESCDWVNPRDAWSPSYRTNTSLIELHNFVDGTRKDRSSLASCETFGETPDDPLSFKFDSKKTQEIKSVKSKQFLVWELFTFTACASSLIYSLAYGGCYNDYVCFRNLMFGSFVFGVFFIVLVLVHKGFFRALVEDILNREMCWNLKLPVLIISSFLLIGFSDFLLLSISAACEVGENNCNEPLLDPHAGNGEVRHITRTLTALCAILFALTVLAYWDHFSYICAHYAWVHAILYCTIIGGVFLEIARCLVRPKKKADTVDVVTLSWSWHSRHPTSEILDWIMLIVLVLVTMFVWLSAIIVALFTEIANWSHEWGVYWATAIYCILALICGITPLAPGSVADAVGGFLLVKIYMHEGYNFFEAMIIASVFVTILHFLGSCLQYWIGKIQAVQAWANFALPSDILAASDSVLLEANCIMVGIVGQVFMDTFNGLNQGRMGMNFCTQFWSEYASLPTAFSWVATGAVLSVQGAKGYEWAADAIPISLLMAATWQFLGTTFGGWKLLNASKDEKFWKNKEKWETVQYFFKLGARATKKGWENDCFCLAKRGEGMERSLFDRIQSIHENYLDEVLCPEKSVIDCKIKQKRKNHERWTARNEHWQKLKCKYFEETLDEDGKLQTRKQYKHLYVTHESVDDNTDQNAWMREEFCSNCTYQLLLVIVAILLGMCSYLAIAKDIETEVAVQDGIKVLEGVGFFEWFIFAIYNLVVLGYYRKWFISSFKSGLSYIRSALLCECCKLFDNPNLETTFKPTWDNTGRDKNYVLML